MEDQNAQPPESDFLQVPEAVAAEESPENADGCGGGVVVVSAGFGDDDRLKKRGRPRKVPQPEFVAAVELSAAAPQKRGRGRPRGSGKWQTLAASFGGTVGDTAGTDFTPCILSIQEGENIVERIWSFSQRIPHSLCILSASGTVSVAEIYLPASRDRLVRYQGQFSIIYLNGSHTYDGKRGGKNCLLSVQLANSEGRFFGGAVAGSLVAAGPTQLIVATFRQKLRQQVNFRPQHVQSPKLSNSSVMVVVPMQAKPAEAETKCEVGDIGSEQSFREVGLKGLNNVSPTPPVWRSVPTSGGS